MFLVFKHLLKQVPNSIRVISDSPFQAKVTDRSLVTLVDDLTDLRDDRDYICLPYNLPSTLTFDISHGGPGKFSRVYYCGEDF